MTSDFRQCAGFKPDGQRCGRVAKEGDYCHSHRQRVEEKPLAPQPLPEGKIKLVSSTAWATCEFCQDAYPLVDLRPDSDGRLACRGCFYRSDILKLTKPTPGEKRRFLAACQAAELARLNKLCFDEAVVELLENGFRPEEHCGYLFFVKSEAKA
jgi:hypothetical protein